jgi:hypothetical protein
MRVVLLLIALVVLTAGKSPAFEDEDDTLARQSQ